MITLDEAVAAVLSGIEPLPSETACLDDALGRVLAEDVRAGADLPPWDNSAMDGYAVRAADVRGAARAHPARLRVVDRIFAGTRPARAVGPGEAARIMTGAELPEGADAVVRQEVARARGGEVEVWVPADPGDNVRRRGEDAAAGSVLVRAGADLDPAAIAALAAAGRARAAVARRPRVAVLAVGDELVDAADLAPGRIADSNGPALAAAARAAGAVAERLPIAPDDAGAIAAALRGAAERCDVVVTAAGASVGERDAVRAALESLGVALAFFGVAIKPGKPAGFGRLGHKLVFALPGNPAASAAAFETLVRPALRALQGARETGRPSVWARLCAPVEKSPGKTYLLRARLCWREGALWAELPPRQGAGQITPAVGANALVVLPAGRARFGQGEPVVARLVGPLPDDAAPRRRAAALSFVSGASDAGKTTLIERLIPALRRRHLRVGAVKHASHGFDLDREGKDSWRMRRAGAEAVALASPRAFAVLADRASPPTLADALASLPPDLDIVLVEGFHAEPAPRVEVHRAGFPRLSGTAGGPLLALVTDDPALRAAPPAGPPCLAPGDIEPLADLLVRAAWEWTRG